MEASLAGLLLQLAFSIGVAVIAYQAIHWWKRRNISSFNRWLVELEDAAIQVIKDDARAAESKANLFALIGELPRDFDPTVFLTCKVGEGLQRAVLLESERRGFVVPGTFEMVFGVPNVGGAPARPGYRFVQQPGPLGRVTASEDNDELPQSFIGTAPAPRPGSNGRTNGAGAPN